MSAVVFLETLEVTLPPAPPRPVAPSPAHPLERPGDDHGDALEQPGVLAFGSRIGHPDTVPFQFSMVPGSPGLGPVAHRRAMVGPTPRFLRSPLPTHRAHRQAGEPAGGAGPPSPDMPDSEGDEQRGQRSCPWRRRWRASNWRQTLLPTPRTRAGPRRGGVKISAGSLINPLRAATRWSCSRDARCPCRRSRRSATATRAADWGR